MSPRSDIPDGYEALRDRMVATQLKARGILDRRVLATVGRVPRHLFVPSDTIWFAYDDSPQDIAERQTISQPYIVGLMTEALELTGTERVLEIGTGSGYQTAILAEMAASVYSVERHRTLANDAFAQLKALGYTNVAIHLGDGSVGWPEQAPYDRIVVTACAPTLTQTLIDQVRVGGIVVIPIGTPDRQSLYKIVKLANGKVAREVLCDCQFVLLHGADGFPNEAEPG